MGLADFIPGVPQAKLIAAGVCAAGLIAGAGTLYLHGRHDAAAALKPKVEAAQAQADTAAAQGAVAAAAAALPAEADRRALDITVHAETAAHAAEEAPGASGAVPADVLAAWAAGVDGVRDEAARARPVGGDSEHPGGGQPAGALPPS